jgi:hypothetical protein
MERTSKTGITAKSLKEAELYGVLIQAAGEAKPLADTEIMRRLYAAEDFYERALAIRFQQTRVFSSPEKRLTSPDVAIKIESFSTTAAPTEGWGPDLAEPAYDYPVNLWDYERWGMLQLRHRPVRAITQVVFTWAGSQRVWKVPADWIQADLKSGTINITPTTGFQAMLSFNAYILSVVAGGRGLPHSILIDYEVGFTPDELAWHHQDLLLGVRLLTLLQLGGIASVAASGGQMSGALSIDGLSHSRGWGGKYGAYSGAITLAIEQEAQIRESWRRQEKGIPMAMLV